MQIVHDVAVLFVGAVCAPIHHLLHGVVPRIVTHGRVHHDLQIVAFAADGLKRLGFPSQVRSLRSGVVGLGGGQQNWHKQQRNDEAKAAPRTQKPVRINSLFFSITHL